MRCPTLNDLPPPPPGQTGWPWTEESPPLPDRMSDGRPWPKISIVTPSYNQGQFIEETIRSVLLQGYPDLEYIVMDGGSTDGTVEMIRKYAPWLAHWVSEPDEGQAQAINKGFAAASGVLSAWINSDDYYFPASWGVIAEQYSQHGDDKIYLGYGHIVDYEGKLLHEIRVTKVVPELLLNTWRENWFLQQAVFWPSCLWNKVGGLKKDFILLMDLDLWLRFAQLYEFIFIDKKVGALRYYPDAKSCALRERMLAEWWMLLATYLPLNQALEKLTDFSKKLCQLENDVNHMTSGFNYRVLKKLGILGRRCSKRT